MADNYATATGSSRRPAMANGAFQIRLTHDLVSLDNAVPSFPYVFQSSLQMNSANRSQEI